MDVQLNQTGAGDSGRSSYEALRNLIKNSGITTESMQAVLDKLSDIPVDIKVDL